VTAPRRAIVEILWGPLGSRKAILEPGQSLRIGRSDRADLALPHDNRMSAMHLAVSWDGERCRVRDLGSSGGTLIQGERVIEADVASGTCVRAGGTTCRVSFEGRSSPDGEVPAEKAAALRELGQRSGLFAVVDASVGARPLQLLREAVDEHRSLYEGIRGEALAGSAPYLVGLRPDSGLLERLLAEGWGARWGIYLACARPFRDVRQHLRRFLIVEDDDSGQRYLFRFYDPRTLRVFLPSCTPRQRQDFFGEIAAFLAEGERGEVLRFDARPGAS
jgi:hypothetical protein